MRYEPMIDPCLSWEQSFDKYQYLIEHYIKETLALLLDFSNKHLPTELRQAWTQLPEENIIRLVTAPNLSEILFTWEGHPNGPHVDSFCSQVEEMILSELYFAGSDVPSDYKAISTPLEDKRSDSLPPLMTNNGIILDYHGHIHRLGLEQAQPLSLEEAHFSQERINKAMELIGLISPQALSLIENFTTTIHLRNDPTQENYSSWSNHAGIGKIVASNFHCVSSQMEQVVDFLIHESTHNFLHLMEHRYGPFLIDEAFEQDWLIERNIASPWSGAPVCLGSFTHAISVWYGLAQFWKKAASHQVNIPELPKQLCEKMFEQACIGFKKPGSIFQAAGEKMLFFHPDYLHFSVPFAEEAKSLSLSL